MKLLTLVVALALIPGLTGVSAAQQRKQKRKGATRQTRRDRDGSPGARMRRRFKESGPAVGDQLPDLSAYDADGKTFRLRSVKGKYTVLVFGCLT